MNARSLLFRLVQEEEGQSLTEYGLVIGLVAVAAIVALKAMGTNINTMLDGVATKLGGIAVK